MSGFVSICLDKKSGAPIYKQLGDALFNLISEGILEPDCKLPPIRKMADCLKINSSTVVSAYKYLESKQAVYSILGSGTFVSPVKQIDEKKAASASMHSAFLPYIISETNVTADFTSTLPPNAIFPLEHIKAAFDSAIEREMGSFFGGTPEKQLECFLGIIAARLRREGITADVDQLNLTGSVESALELAASTIVNKGDYVVLEKPVSAQRTASYAARGAKILHVPIDTEGIDLDIFEAFLKMYHPRVVHLSTYFQSPTNVCYSMEVKKRILELCCKYGTIIIEEDLYSGLLPGERKIHLKSLDYKGQVIYVKSITKTCLPWFNLNVCIFPKRYAPNAENPRFYGGSSDSSVQLKILHEIFISNSADEVSKKIVKYHESSYKKTAETINEKLAEFVEFDCKKTGIGFWLKIKKGDSMTLAQRCAKRGVLIVPGNMFLSEEGSYFRLCAQNVDVTTLNIGFNILREELTSLHR